MNHWQISTILYLIVSILSFGPVFLVFISKIQPQNLETNIKENQHFSERSKLRLIQNYRRIDGALGFWKREAKRHRYFNSYCTWWTIPITIAIPALTQATSNSSDSSSALFITVVSTHAAILIALSKGLKTGKNFKSYRKGESEYYDTFRRLMDSPTTFGKSEDEQLTNYFRRTETIRQTIREEELANSDDPENNDN